MYADDRLNQITLDQIGYDVDLVLDAQQLASAAGVTVADLADFTGHGLLPPPIPDAARAVYTYEHVAAARLVGRLRDAGLPWRTIGELVAQNRAEQHLDHLDFDWSTARAQLRTSNSQLLSSLARTRPDLLRELVEAGVVHLNNGELSASPGCLAVATALLSQGAEITQVCELVVTAIRRARELTDDLWHEASALGDEPLVALGASLAALVCVDTLHAAGDKAEVAPAVDPDLPDAAVIHLNRGRRA